MTEQLLERLQRIEEKVDELLNKPDRQEEQPQEAYSTADLARILGKAEWTVREWCRLGRIHADKRPCGRGTAKEWMISHDELQRIQNEGLLPLVRAQSSGQPIL